MNQIYSPTNLKTTTTIIVGKEFNDIANNETNWVSIRNYSFWGYSLDDTMKKIGNGFVLDPYMGQDTELLKVSSIYKNTLYTAYSKAAAIFSPLETIANELVQHINKLEPK